MKKIYLVSFGTYSDYNVIAIFSKKELAEEFMRLVPAESYSEYNEIEEMEIDPPYVAKIKSGYSLWKIVMSKNGDVHICNKDKLNSYSLCNTCLVINAFYKDVRGSVMAKNEKHAIKIANEFRTKSIAEGKL